MGGAALGLTACGSASADLSESTGAGTEDSAAFDLCGSFTLYDADMHSDCQGIGGYGDIGPGTSVTVTDASDTIVGTGMLKTLPKSSDNDNKGSWISNWACVYAIAVNDVPKVSDFYGVEVSHRGSITVTAAEAEAGEVKSSLGTQGE